MSRRKRRIFLGYCPRCGRDVEADFCDECMQACSEAEAKP